RHDRVRGVRVAGHHGSRPRRIPGRPGTLQRGEIMNTLLSLLIPLCLLQSVEYRSPAGVDYRAQRDTGAIARAESALAADPRNIDRIIALGVAQSGVRQYREAIETFTRGLK